MVRAALRHPITVFVLVIAITLATLMALVQMPRDILPSLGIPTIYIAQPYGGLSPSQMESYVTYYYEYHFLYINGIEHIESRNIQSAALIKLQFYPGTDMAAAEAETVSYVSRSRAFMPPGTVPPFVIRYDAGAAPVGDLVFEADHRSLAELQDMALNSVRPLFATLKGLSAPPPFGASARTIVISLDPTKMAHFNLSAAEVTRKIVETNSIVPSGNLPVGGFWPIVPMNSVVDNIQTLLDAPIRLGTVPTVYLKDIGTIQDTTDIPTSYALVNGKRTVYVPVTKHSDASTLSVVDEVKANLQKFEEVLPKDVKIRYEFDQSVYVKEAIRSLFIEGVLGALLTGLMVLLFLRDVRSVLIVILNIPLSLGISIFSLWITGQTINVMTLGGLALAVGILVDETTVTIENFHTHVGKGRSKARAALVATSEVLGPELLTLFCVLSVFVPSFLMTGVSKALFVPLTLAVGLSMVGSFLLSMTLVPVLESRFYKEKKRTVKKQGRFSFERFRERYSGLLERMMGYRRRIVGAYLALTLCLAAMLVFGIGREIFPIANQGQFRVRIRAPTGTILDDTEKLTKRVFEIIDQVVGPQNIDTRLAFVGTQPPEYPINDVYEFTSGTQEAVINVAFKPSAKINIEGLKEELRKRIRHELPDIHTSFEPSGLIDSMMSQGAPTPIEIAVNGPNLQIDKDYSEKIRKAVEDLPFLRDVQYGQPYEYPAISVNVDRARAGLMGLTVADVGRALVPATSSSRWLLPNYWVDPKNGINYQVQVMIPQGRIDSIDKLKNLPVTVNDGAIPLHRFAEVVSSKQIGEYDRYNMERMVTLTANLSGEDLGHAARKIEARIKPLLAQRPRGVDVHLRGQVKSLDEMLRGLTSGLVLAIVVVFLLLSANFESFSLALSIMAVIPAVLCGALAVLFITGTTLNIESFMGSIMAIGVAIANSVLLVTFAERHRRESADAIRAAIEGASSRIRPILMTTLAMLFGMIPMSLGLSEGGKQSAPLGRAVMGGLAGSTLTTLLVLPLVFAVLRRGHSIQTASLDPDDENGASYEGGTEGKREPQAAA